MKVSIVELQNVADISVFFPSFIFLYHQVTDNKLFANGNPSQAGFNCSSLPAGLVGNGEFEGEFEGKFEEI